MEVIDKDKFEEAKDLPELKKDEPEYFWKEFDSDNFQSALEKMKNPVSAMQEMAAKIKKYLDKTMEKDMKKYGKLTDGTRRWVQQYNVICEGIQKALYGDKSVNVHLHKVSHSQIAAKMRQAV